MIKGVITMILNEVTKAKLIKDMIEMAERNHDKQCYINPSKYGFRRISEDTEIIKDYLKGLDVVKNVKIEGKDLLLVTLNL